MRGRGRKTWYECVKDMKVLGLHAEWAVFRDMWRGFIFRVSLAERRKMDVLKINDDDDEFNLVYPNE